jgi:hypothetical protein
MSSMAKPYTSIDGFASGGGWLAACCAAAPRALARTSNNASAHGRDP